ncbi:MAG: polyisoprenoid-binding protein YceI [Rhodothermales bacterium]|jgi:polyisoprenoid-binding protein YceI
MPTRTLALIFFSLCVSCLHAVDVKIDTVSSSVNFKIRHLGIANVRGHFAKFSGEWSVDPESQKLTALTGTVSVASVDTGEPKRDKHLCNEDFFETEKYPDMTIKMTGFGGEGTSSRVTAELTIKGVTKKVLFQGEVSPLIANPFNGGKTRKHGLSLSTTINRMDFKVGENFKAPKVGEEVTIMIDLEGDAPGE